MRIVAIVQARMASTRLPGKVLRDLCGEPMLARVVERVRRAKRVNDMIVATSTLPADHAIAELCAARNWSCFHGSEADVLDRYVGAAQAADADVVVRITADCPLIDPQIIDEVIAVFLEGQPALDYACNFHPSRTFPRGLDTEVFSRAALERCHLEASDAASREHVTAFIYRNPERFRLRGLQSLDGDWSALRWTVDTSEDFDFVANVYRHFGHDRFTWREVLAALEKYSQWSDVNRHIEQKSL